MPYSDKAEDRAIQFAAWASETTDAGVRAALLDLAAGYMKLAGELKRSQILLDFEGQGFRQTPPTSPSPVRGVMN
jgi:hypothetical protein